jgi:hypothetical protein
MGVCCALGECAVEEEGEVVERKRNRGGGGKLLRPAPAVSLLRPYYPPLFPILPSLLLAADLLSRVGTTDEHFEPVRPGA